MGKFSGLLFCTDLDGTLYDDARTVSTINRDAIRYFQAEGGLFTFITGRVPITAAEICELIAPNAPYGCINGGGIYEPRTGTYLWNTFLPEAARVLVSTVQKQMPDMGFQLNTESGIFFLTDNAAMGHFREITGVPDRRCTYETIGEPVLKVVFAHDVPERIDALEQLLTQHPLANQVDFIRSEKSLYEILPKGVSKGAALMKMAELLSIEPQKTIAVGDYYNDVSMIQAAGLGVAVENAVDAVKAVAKRVTVSNNEHAIAAIIEEIDRGEIVIG